MDQKDQLIGALIRQRNQAQDRSAELEALYLVAKDKLDNLEKKPVEKVKSK